MDAKKRTDILACKTPWLDPCEFSLWAYLKVEVIRDLLRIILDPKNDCHVVESTTKDTLQKVFQTIWIRLLFLASQYESSSKFVKLVETYEPKI